MAQVVDGSSFQSMNAAAACIYFWGGITTDPEQPRETIWDKTGNDGSQLVDLALTLRTVWLLYKCGWIVTCECLRETTLRATQNVATPRISQGHRIAIYACKNIV